MSLAHTGVRLGSPRLVFAPLITRRWESVRAKRAASKTPSMAQANASPRTSSRPPSSIPVSSKIQVIPFATMPREALLKAISWTGGAVLHRRCSGNTWAAHWQMLLAIVGVFTGFKVKVPLLRMKRWRAIYLPFYKVDSFMNLDIRLHGHAFKMDVTSKDIDYPATDVPPLSTFPDAMPHVESHQDVMQPFNPAKHLKFFKSEDMPDGEAPTKPVLLPFSAIPTAFESIYQKVTARFRHENVRFHGEVVPTVQAVYPLLAPCYLIDYTDVNPKYQDQAITCVVSGADLHGERGPVSPFAVYTNGNWDVHSTPRPSVELRLYPKVPESAQRGKISLSYNDPAEGARAAAESGSVEGAEGNDGFAPGFGVASAARDGQQAMYELLPKIDEEVKLAFESFKDDTTLQEATRRFDSTKWIMSYPAFAQKNRQYGDACVEARGADQELAGARALPEFPDDTSAKVFAIRRGGLFGVSAKFQNASELNEDKKKAIVAAQEKLAEAQKLAASLLPSWMR